MVQDEPELVRVHADLWGLTLAVDDAGSQAGHHRVVHHRANLEGSHTHTPDGHTHTHTHTHTGHTDGTPLQELLIPLL